MLLSGLPSPARKHVIGVSWQLTHDLDGSWRQRHTVVFTGFHPLGGNGPDGVVEINLGQPSTDCFARPRRGEDREL